MDFSLLYFFIPVFFVVSITPGLCMTLALTMGMSIGLGKYHENDGGRTHRRAACGHGCGGGRWRHYRR